MIKKEKILELKNRKILYNYVERYPGVHLNELFRKIQLNNNTIRYHIKYLIKHGYIDCKKINGYNHYYTKENNNSDKKILMSFLRKTTTRNIMLYLLIGYGATQIKLSEELEKTPTTISFHLKRLQKSGIIETVPLIDGKIRTNRKIIKYANFKTDGKIVYKIVDPYFLYDLLIENKDKFNDNGLTKSLLDHIKNMKTGETHIESNNIDKSFETVHNMLFEIFPHYFYG